MNFDLPEAVAPLLPRIRDVVERRLFPLERRLNEPFSALVDELEDVRREVKGLGLFLPQIPMEHGGLGLSVLEHAFVSQELGRSPLGHYAFNCQAPDAGNMEILMEFGTAEQKTRWLRPLLTGEIRSCFSMTEPEVAGSNPTWMLTRARREGDEYVLDGHKWFSSSADGASFAVVMAVTDPNAEKHRQASQILVPLPHPGVRLVRNVPVMGHAGDSWMSHAELAYENCRVPVSNVLKGEGEGFAIAQARLGPGRIHHAMRWLGICERSFELMVARAGARELSPGEPLWEKQIVQTWIAECRVAIDAARLKVLETAWKMDRHGQKAVREDISLIKFHVAKVMTDVVDRALQVHGALGMTDDTVLAFFYRHERAAHIYDGPDEVHKGVVARAILKRAGRKTAR